MSISVYDLTYGFLKKYCTDDIDDSLITATMNDMKRVLDEGWTAEELINLMKHRKRSAPEFFMFVGSSSAKKREDNLLDSDTYYWHPQLRVMPGPPQRLVDYDSGEITKVEEPYFLEMRASYTLSDLFNYYTKQHGEPEVQGEVKKWRGALNYLLGQYSLDTVLFMIDASANYIQAEDFRPLNSPLDMADYVKEAQRAMGEKITEERTAGDEGIVPRKRLPLHRGRSKTTERTLQA